MKRESQKDKVLKWLRENGSISRNWCLKNFISRLSSIMLDLKEEGVNFETKRIKGDYVYVLKDKPKDVITYFVDGKLVGSKTIW